ncbi:YsnF/AvaK domain-containing protein [Microvirga arabica]|uniref:YsnF/AvaK domain-containing protein n=1 Tax=Microvirga arabica TaxID=1128671 RepID=A0ABV6Y616_9HYPH|nr:YsnF/AvaK domain-containing protein [Microvirga arabica]MBM1169809.1 YsnF/AvaK domain-containing protein [Microvirga arabica]
MAKHISDQPNAQDSLSDTEVIPITEEELRLDKREVITGKVRVRTSVDVETELVKATLEGETIEVTRVPVDRIVERAPEVRTENDVTIIPILEEVLVVEKRLVLKEELHLHRRRTTENVEAPVELRKQRAVIERVPSDDTNT